MGFFTLVVWFIVFGFVGQKLKKSLTDVPFNWYFYSAGFWITQFIITLMRG